MTALTRTPVSLRHRLTASGVTVRTYQTVQPGKIIWWRGRKRVAITNTVDFTRPPQGANEAWVSPADYDALQGE
jgi:hypothetical protein